MDTIGSLTIVGAGNHSLDIRAIAARCNLSVAVYDEDPLTGFPRLPDGFASPIVIGINDSAVRLDVATRLGLPGAEALVDPSATFGTHIALGAGTVVASHAVLLTQVQLGDHVHVNYNVGMTRCKVADFSTVGPGATICGNVQIGERTTIGAGAVICERTLIGDNVIVGAGAIVPPYSVVPNETRVIGVWKNV